MTWGYDRQPSIIAEKQTKDPANSLSRLSLHLLIDVERARVADPDRPIIFISHSYGGLIVKKMLMESSLRPSVGPKSLPQCTIGLLFFGTPKSLNSKFLESARPFQRLLIALKENKSLPVADDFLRHNDLAEVNENAHKVITDAKISVTSFFEMRPTARLGLIVPLESVVIGTPTEQVIGLDTSHVEMVKISHPSDYRYQDICHSIKGMLNKSAVTSNPFRQAPISQNTHQDQKLRKEGGARSYGSKLKTLKATLQDIESKLNSDPDAHKHSYRLQTEISCFKEAVGSLQKRNRSKAKNGILERSTLDFITGLTGRLQRLSGDAGLWNGGVEKNEDVRINGAAKRILEDMATDISRSLTIVNTMLLLKADRRYLWDVPHESSVYNKVKIAILDSGLAPEHKGLVSDYVDFTDPHWTAHMQPTDLIGHGTFVTDLLWQMIPSAEFYSARVMTGTEDEDDNSISIAQGLRHAVEKWDVDIISMSFSSEKPAKNITESIELCIKDQILLFAAACNSGAQGTPTIGYPASHLGGVFCIHSSDEFGNASKFTPPAKVNSDNFSTIGENIVAAWPKSLMQTRPGTYDAHSGAEESEDEGVDLDSDEEDRGDDQDDDQPTIAELCGTSMATPIAAGIAALVIEFCRQHRDLLSDSDADEIETHRGMHALLKFMSDGNRRSGYDWIKPWQLFPRGWDPERIAVLISYALLQS
ncbi:hypothetical protein Daus18300_009755 [Diaporthe australafricana]|uniref:Peptidase S8/S53 domain-containing protein n=1 Tax=Diaporthe australafricana TaxID=127596 RepID=A0ABR3WDH3_9PEZI